jgi:hypothetical protein
MGEKYRKRDNPSRSCLREHNLTIEDLRNAYVAEGSIRRASKKVGISTTSFHRTMVADGFSFTKKGKIHASKQHTSIVAAWITKNPTVILPRQYKGIADITNIPVQTIRAYFKRRQDRLQSILQRHNNIIDLPFFGMPNTNGQIIINKNLKETQITIDNFALCYIIKAVTLSGNKITFIMQLPDYLEMFNQGEHQ